MPVPLGEPDYRDFDEFLATLKHRKRKNIRQERRKVDDSGVSIRWLDGHQAREQDWRDFVRLYRRIYDRKYGMPAFNQEFFMDIAAAMPGRYSWCWRAWTIGRWQAP